MRRTLVLLVVTLSLISAFTTACGDSSADSGSESSSATAPGDGGASPGDTASPSGTPMAASSPIGAFFDGGFDDALAEYRLQVEEKILLCMAEQGFEFAVGDNRGANEVERQQNELTTREWTARYGYGISTSFDSIARDQTTDPNAAIVLQLSAAERELWFDTLSGGSLTLGGGNLGSRPLEEQGCIGQAVIDTGGQEAIEGLTDFGSVYDEGLDALFDRRDMIDAVDAWSRCMSEAGYPDLTELDAPEDDIRSQYREVIAPVQAALVDLPPEQGQALISGESFDLADLPDLDLDALRALQDDELLVATADLDCYEANVQAVYEPLRDEFENGLLEEYATEFEALKNIGG